MSYIFVTNYDDWEGIYDTDGLLIDEGHKLDWINLFNNGFLSKPAQIITVEAGYWLQDVGSLPYKYEDFIKNQRGEEQK